MVLNYKAYAIDYDYLYRESDKNIIFLHGWGGNKNSFKLLFPYLNSYNLLTISFPPYFLNKNYTESIIPIKLSDYLNILKIILRLHNIKSATIICHSFGFRITLLLLTSAFKINSVVVTGGAGLNTPKNFIKTLNLNSKIIYYKHMNIVDPKLEINLLKGKDKITFTNIVNTKLFMPQNLIYCPTLLFWGKHDKSTPLKIAKMLKQTIHNSRLILTNSDHFSYLNNSNKFIENTLEFLGKYS